MENKEVSQEIIKKIDFQETTVIFQRIDKIEAKINLIKIQIKKTIGNKEVQVRQNQFKKIIETRSIKINKMNNKWVW
jgi:hypothetical protein